MNADKLSRDDDPTASYPAVNAPAAPLSAAASGDRCGNCHAPLAPDQRYCVSCGERRGRARFAPSAFSGSDVAEPASVPPAESRRPRASSGTVLIAFVATLLVAIGLGVLIGHDSNANHGTAAASRPTYKISVYGGGSGAPGTAGSSSTGSGSATKAGKSSGKAVKTKPITAAAAQKVAAKGAAAANKTLGTSKSNLPPATVKQGGACAKGAGCQGGKFTGKFFGP
jgi:hypothetical protein